VPRAEEPQHFDPPAPEADERWAVRLVCSEGRERAHLDRPAFLSAAGAPWLVDYDLDKRKGETLRERLAGRPWGMWRYRELLPIQDFGRRIDLGEGGTPLVPVRRARPDGVRVWLKDEKLNPTGSFKDRGLSLAVNRARELGAPGVQIASAGNAALALTAYAAAAGLPAKVALPEDTPETVARRCKEHGAQVLTSPGTLVEAARRLEEKKDGFWTLSTLREPYRLEGKKTLGFELAEQWGWSLPDWIVYPTGGGTGLIGMHKAFGELEALGLIEAGRRPRFVAVQMEGCAPLVRAFEAGADHAEPWESPKTSVWGLRVPRLLGDRLVLRALEETAGAAVAVPESSITDKTRELAREGLRVGPEGAACFTALDRLARKGVIAPEDRVVVFQTGDPANYG
jgi:threonine synthase